MAQQCATKQSTAKHLQVSTQAEAAHRPPHPALTAAPASAPPTCCAASPGRGPRCHKRLDSPCSRTAALPGLSSRRRSRRHGRPPARGAAAARERAREGRTGARAGAGQRVYGRCVGLLGGWPERARICGGRDWLKRGLAEEQCRCPGAAGPSAARFSPQEAGSQPCAPAHPLASSICRRTASGAGRVPSWEARRRSISARQTCEGEGPERAIHAQRLPVLD